MNILLLGDSLVEYFNWKSRFPEHTCINLGMAGESVGGLLSRIGSTKRFCPEADMIFIMSGINNVAMEDTDFIEQYRSIIRELTSSYPAAAIFINSLLPTAADFISNSAIMEVNTLLQTLASVPGVEFLDIYSLFTDRNGDTIRDYLLEDGVHLSAAGYLVWSAALERTINR